LRYLNISSKEYEHIFPVQKSKTEIPEGFQARRFPGAGARGIEPLLPKLGLKESVRDLGFGLYSARRLRRTGATKTSRF
jgi:hypothetical protein